MRRSGGWQLFPTVLSFRILDRLPLHIARIVAAAALQRCDVVDHVTRATAGIAGGLHELLAGRAAPFDTAVVIAGDRGSGGVAEKRCGNCSSEPHGALYVEICFLIMSL